MPGKYLKGAARSCAGKARFETADEANKASNQRLRSYRCVVCGTWHLTSQGGAAPQSPDRETPVSRFASLSDLQWPEVSIPEAPQTDGPTRALCVGKYDREGRILLDVGGRRVRSHYVAVHDRETYGDGVSVRIRWQNGRPMIVARAVD